MRKLITRKAEVITIRRWTESMASKTMHRPLKVMAQIPNEKPLDKLCLKRSCEGADAKRVVANGIRTGGF